MDSESDHQNSDGDAAVSPRRCLLVKQAEAYLGVISRSTVEDKDQLWALFSPEPSRVTGPLYRAWNL